MTSFFFFSFWTGKDETTKENHAPLGLGCVGPQQPAVDKLFQQLSVSEQEELLFIQLPDAIPGQPASTSAEPSAKKDGKPDDKNPSKLKTQVKHV